MQSNKMDKNEAMTSSTHSFAYYKTSKFIFFYYFLSDFNQIDTVLFENVYSFYWRINPGLD